MLYSIDWLRRFTPVPELPMAEITEAITRHVVEVEGILDMHQRFSGVVVGKILEISKHPNADKLQCTITTTDGENRLQIVCGAHNIAVGQIVPVALPGATVLDRKTGESFTIKDSVIRGEFSQGMLCSADELGISPVEDGIHQLPQTTPLGASVADVLGLGDTIFDVKGVALSNRPDLWGHWGMARELSVLFKTPLSLPRLPQARAELGIPVVVEHDTETRRYIALIVTGVRATQSPPWLARRLEQLGIRSVNAIVDVTNLVMLETGQPLHAFDARTARDISVRRARPEERLTTFDGTDLTLSAEDVVIATHDSALALAGIIGGVQSGVQADTDSIVLEAASFDPVRVRKTAARLGLRTDAVSRFEKDVDPALAPLAAARAVQLYQELFPAARLVGRTDIEPLQRAPGKILTSVSELSSILGAPLDRTDVNRVLTGLGFTARGRGDILELVVPTFRGGRDVTTAADVAEELGRFMGYDTLPAARLAMPLTIVERSAAARIRLSRSIIEYATIGLGATELLTPPLTSDEELRRFRLVPEEHLRLRNPQTVDAVLLRTTLLPGLAAAAWRNARVTPRALLVELGPVFHSDAGTMKRSLEGDAVLPYGGDDTDALDRLRAALEALALSIGLPSIHFVADRDPVTPLHPGRSATVRCAEQTLGILGELHPSIRLQLDGHRMAFAELDIDTIVALAHDHPRTYEQPPLFPGSTKDISVSVDEQRFVDDIVDAVRNAHIATLLSVRAIDVFRGGDLAEGKKSVTLRLELRAPDHTLSEKEIEDAIAGATAALTSLGGEIR